MDKFDRPNQPRSHDTEEWGHNEHGCFSFSSGRFIPKAKEDYSYLEQGITWPGNLKDEKNERH